MDLRDFTRKPKPTTRYLFFDCETHLITQEDRIPPLVCMQYAFDDEDPVILGGTDEEIARIRHLFLSWLNDPNIVLVTHGGFFDYSEMLELNNYKNGSTPYQDELILKVLDAALAGRIRDTVVMGKLNAIEFDWLDFDRQMWTKSPPFTLEYLTRKFTGQDVKGKSGPDVWRLRYKELHGLHPDLWPEAAREYALMDVIHLRNTFRAIGRNTYADEAFQTATAWCLYLMGLWGIHTDPVRVDAWSNYVQPRVARAVDQLVKAGLMRYNAPKLNTESRAQAIESVCRSRGVEPRRTPSGKIASDAKYLASLDAPFLMDRSAWTEPQSPSKNEAVIKARVQAWYTRRGLEVPMTEGTRNEDGTVRSPPEISLSRDVLEATCNENVPEAERDLDLGLLAEIGEFETLMSTFLPAFRRSQCLHPFWNVLVSTGRVSVSAGKGSDAAGVNLNNIPTMRGVRECFVARPGYVFWDGDYEQAELCSLAQVCIDKFGYSKLAEIIRSGRDVHTIFGIELVILFGEERLFESSDWEGRYREFKRQSKKGGKFYSWRQLAKAFDFGLPGGLGQTTFLEWALATYSVTMPGEQFKPAKESWLGVVPEVRDLFSWVSRRCKESYDNKFTFTQHRSGRRRGGCNYTVGCNTGFQGLTSDGAKNALIKIFREAHTPGSDVYGCRIVAQIYDEFLIEVPAGLIDKAHPRLMELMKLGMEEYTPDVPASVTAEVMKHWSKAAKLAVVNGKIVPFDEITEGLWAGLTRFLGWRKS